MPGAIYCDAIAIGHGGVDTMAVAPCCFGDVEAGFGPARTYGGGTAVGDRPVGVADVSGHSAIYGGMAALAEHCSVFEYLVLTLAEDRHVVSARVAEYVVDSGPDFDCATSGGGSVGGGSVVGAVSSVCDWGVFVSLGASPVRLTSDDCNDLFLTW